MYKFQTVIEGAFSCSCIHSRKHKTIRITVSTDLFFNPQKKSYVLVQRSIGARSSLNRRTIPIPRMIHRIPAFGLRPIQLHGRALLYPSVHDPWIHAPFPVPAFTPINTNPIRITATDTAKKILRFPRKSIGARSSLIRP